MTKQEALRKILFGAQLPFVGTFLLGIVAWLLTHLSDRIIQTPTLEYKLLRQELSPQEKAHPNIFPPQAGTSETVQKDVFRITNVSQTARFGKIKFLVGFPSDAKERIRFAWTHYNDLAKPRTQASGEMESVPPDTDGIVAWYPVQELHPGWNIDLVCFHTGPALPQLGFSTEIDTAVRLVAANFETWLSQNESEVMFYLAIVFLVFTVIYLVLISLIKPPQTI